MAAYNPSWNGLFFTKILKGKTARKKLEDAQLRNLNAGWWSNANPVGVINHEMGHYAHHVIDTANGSTICDHHLSRLLERFRDEAADGAAVDWTKWGKPESTPSTVLSRAQGHGVSGYALANVKELVAESFAQLYDGSVSPQAKEVLKVLLRHGNMIDFPENALLKRRLEQL